MEIRGRNVNNVFKKLVEGIHTKTIPTVARTSRYGNVLMIPEPLLVTYEKPTEKVLFNPKRDVPIPFLVYEALWMLAGRQDVAPLAYYLPKMREFSDDGKVFNAAYGYRWRYADTSGQGYYSSVDQLKVIIDHLKAKPDSRRAVLQIWNVEQDLLQADTSKDLACNVCAFFALRAENTGPGDYGDEYVNYLDMTVINRSNDICWGMLGANVVHFAFLQEYVAAHLRAKVGRYHQISNNAHVYEATWQPEKWLVDYDQGGTWSHEWYESEGMTLVPLVQDSATFDKELPEFVEEHSGKLVQPVITRTWQEPFLQTVAQPMCNAFHCHKLKEPTLAKSWCNQIANEDWRVALRGWLERREAKQGVKV